MTAKNGTKMTLDKSAQYRRCWIWVALVVAGTAVAGQRDLDRAVERYYAGYPAQAVAMLEPLARAGDVDAQYLLGNMTYALARAGTPLANGDPVSWYGMAAERGSAEAAHALGAIYNNRWLESRDDGDARLAEYYYQQAADRGHSGAEARLLKLASRNNANSKSASLTYTNDSFASKQVAPEQPAEKPPAAAREPALSEFRMTGDPIADAARLREMLGRLGASGVLPGVASAAANPPEPQSVRDLLTGLGADAQLIDNLMQLMEHVQSVTEHSLAPGAN